MEQKISLEEIFEQHKEYAGSNLKISRMCRMMITDDLFELLKNDPHWSGISLATLKEMEKGRHPVTFMQAKSAARVMETSIESFINGMIFAKSNEGISEEESIKLLGENLCSAIKELLYQEWKKEQKKLEGE